MDAVLKINRKADVSLYLFQRGGGAIRPQCWLIAQGAQAEWADWTLFSKTGVHPALLPHADPDIILSDLSQYQQILSPHALPG